MTEAQETSLARLTQSTETLLKLLSMNAPPVIVCGQVSQIFGQALMAYGEMLYTELGKSIRLSKLIASGHCPRCERRFENDNPALEYAGHCPECRQALGTEHLDPSRN